MNYLRTQPVAYDLVQEKMGAAFNAELNEGRPEKHFNPFTPTGAEKLTSDIDVASGGLNTEIGVRLFNQIFRENLGVNWDPATVFDYNVYAADWIFPNNFLRVNRGGVTEITPGPEDVLARDAGADPKDDERLQAERARPSNRPPCSTSAATAQVKSGGGTDVQAAAQEE